MVERMGPPKKKRPHVSLTREPATSPCKFGEGGLKVRARLQLPSSSITDNVYLVPSVYNPDRESATSYIHDSDKERYEMLRTAWRREWITKRTRENDDLTLLAARRIFGALDVDNDGRLSGDELEHLAAWMWSTFNESDGQPTKAELDEATDYSLCLMDVNNTGVIDFQSFCKWYLTSTAMEQPQV